MRIEPEDGARLAQALIGFAREIVRELDKGRRKRVQAVALTFYPVPKKDVPQEDISVKLSTATNYVGRVPKWQAEDGQQLGYENLRVENRNPDVAYMHVFGGDNLFLQVFAEGEAGFRLVGDSDLDQDEVMEVELELSLTFDAPNAPGIATPGFDPFPKDAEPPEGVTLVGPGGGMPQAQDQADGGEEAGAGGKAAAGEVDAEIG